MADTFNYFRQLPDFDYISRVPENTEIDTYIRVKNLFKRVKIREDIFQNLAYFTNYKIIGDERPDQVAQKIYDDQNLDWVVLLSNNIVSVHDEWPLPQNILDQYLLEKYGSYDELYSVKYYESVEYKDSLGSVILPGGLKVDQDYSFTYYDIGLGSDITVTNITKEVTNYDYEIKKEDDKRNIFLIKPLYLSVVLDDIKSTMEYKKGSTQYQSRTVKKADNIRLHVN
jgi:hypothetical protein